MDTIPIKPSDLPQWLKRWMEDSGQTVMQLATSMRVSRQTIYNILDGGWPSRKVMEKLGMHLIWEKNVKREK